MRPMPMVTVGRSALMPRGQRFGDRFQNDGEGAGIADRAGIGLDPRPVGPRASLRLESTPDMEGIAASGRHGP